MVSSEEAELSYSRVRGASRGGTRVTLAPSDTNALLEQEGVGHMPLLGSTATALKIFFLVRSGSVQPHVEPQPIGEGLQQGVSGAVACCLG